MESISGKLPDSMLSRLSESVHGTIVWGLLGLSEVEVTAAWKNLTTVHGIGC
jgi:hypothetical protein